MEEEEVIAVACGGGSSDALRDLDQSPKRLQAFFHLHWVHHCSLWSMPYTLRHFLFSPRVRRFGDSGDRLAPPVPGLVPGATNGPPPLSVWPPLEEDDDDEDEMIDDDDEDWGWYPADTVAPPGESWIWPRCCCCCW